MSLMVFLMDNSSLIVVGPDEKKYRVKFDAGDIFLFGSQVVHAGDANNTEYNNYRLHMIIHTVQHETNLRDQPPPYSDYTHFHTAYDNMDPIDIDADSFIKLKPSL